MKTREIVHTLITQIKNKEHDCCVVNIASPDIVGHTGVLSATVRAIEIVDECLAELEPVILAHDGVLFITADHGNCEYMIEAESDNINTEHSTNPVPFIAIAKELKQKNITLMPGILADIAPTYIQAMDIPIPSEMSGRDLLEELNE